MDLVSRTSSHGFSARLVGSGPRSEPEVLHSLCIKPFGQLALVQIKTAKMMLRHSPAQAIYRWKIGIYLTYFPFLLFRFIGSCLLTVGENKLNITLSSWPLALLAIVLKPEMIENLPEPFVHTTLMICH